MVEKTTPCPYSRLTNSPGKKNVIRSPDGLFYCPIKGCEHCHRNSRLIAEHISNHVIPEAPKGPSAIENRPGNDCLPPTQLTRSIEPRKNKWVDAQLVKIVDERHDIYEWSCKTQRCTHHLRDPLPSTSFVDSSCAALSYFGGAFYSPFLRAIISSTPGGHTLVLAAGDLEDFFKQSFTHKFRQGLGEPLSDVIKHVAQAFSMTSSEVGFQDSFLGRLNTLTIPAPHPGFPEPTEAVQCPGCNQWYTSKKTFHQHPGKGMKCSLDRSAKDAFKKTYQQNTVYSQPFTVHKCVGGVKSGRRLSLPRGWMPAKASSDSPHPTCAPNYPYQPPSYFKELGWWEYVSQFSLGDLATLLEFTATPSVELINAVHATRMKTLVSAEKGLVVLSRKIVPKYLLEAQTLLKKYHVGLRDAITIECVSFGKTIDHSNRTNSSAYSGRPAFRILKDETFDRYKAFVVILFSFVIRYLLRLRMERNQKLGLKAKAPSNFVPMITRAQVMSGLFLFPIWIS